MPENAASVTLRYSTSLFTLPLLLLIAPEYIMGQPVSSVAPASHATQSGTVFGRILNSATGQYLHNASVSVKGTNIIAFTDGTGTYRLTNVPLGPVTLEVSFTGMGTKQAVVTLASPEPVEQNIELAGASGRNDSSETQRLTDFVVTARPMEGSAIAIQEQRVAPNIKNVVSVDEFGLVPDGNVGEFLKLLP